MCKTNSCWINHWTFDWIGDFEMILHCMFLPIINKDGDQYRFSKYTEIDQPIILSIPSIPKLVYLYAYTDNKRLAKRFLKERSSEFIYRKIDSDKEPELASYIEQNGILAEIICSRLRTVNPITRKASEATFILTEFEDNLIHFGIFMVVFDIVSEMDCSISFERFKVFKSKYMNAFTLLDFLSITYFIYNSDIEIEDYMNGYCEQFDQMKIFLYVFGELVENLEEGWL